MFLSELLFDTSATEAYTARTFPEYASACPPLHSMPGVICNTSNIWEHVLDLASMMLLKKGDVITLREESRNSAKIKELIEGLENRIAPKWLTVDKDAVKATVDALPVREDIDFPFEEQLIVELYSK